MLLTADWHLDANPDHAYRWEVLKVLKSNAQFGSRIGILGDMTDNKDKFPASMVNSLVYQLVELTKCGVDVDILMGNHDAPISGVPFWWFLNNIQGIRYHTSPTTAGSLLWLPWTNSPQEAWKNIPLVESRVVFLHQLLTGSVVNGRAMESKIPLSLPKGPVYYAGDIHEPQIVGGVTYVGAPHPVDFGDEHPCHILQINAETGMKERVIQINGIKKRSISIRSIADLEKLKNVSEGDQMAITIKLDAANANKAPALEAAIRGWAESNKVVLPMGVDFSLEMGDKTFVYNPETTDVQKILTEFAQSEGISGHLLDAGKRILEGAKKKIL